MGINLSRYIILCSFADTSRHYLPIDVIKQVIESMSYAKLVRCCFSHSHFQIRIYCNHSSVFYPISCFSDNSCCNSDSENYNW